MIPAVAQDDPAAALRGRVAMLGRVVGDVLRAHAGAQTFAAVERLRVLARERRAGDPAADAAIDAVLDGLDVETAIAVIRAFGLYFRMVNLAEQLHRERRRRERARRGEPPQRGALETLPADAAARIAGVELRLVFTAHPTEVLRRTTSEKLLAIATILRELDERALTPEELAECEAELRAQIVLLWQSTELYRSAPTIHDEVRNLVARFRETLIDETTALFARLEDRLGSAVPTILRFGSWIGGDRDGNPNVAPDAIAAAHEQGRRFILERYVADVEALQVRYSQDAQRGGASPALIDSIEADARELPDVRYAIGARQEGEPYRRKLAFVHRRLRLTLADAPGGYAGAGAFAAELELLARSLEAPDAAAVARPLHRLRRAVDVFGFSLCALEWRQHRDRVVAALAGLLGDEDPGDPAARDVVASLRAVAALRERRGAGSVHSLILAGTESADDVVALLRLARLCGALDAGPLQIVPLLESPTALAGAAAICARALDDPGLRANVARCGERWEIMLGYSDTTKVMGTIAAGWGVYRAQEAIGEALRGYGVGAAFFHGRGGSAGRGAADVRDAIDAQPPAARDGHFKVTEQGEIIGARYGLPSLARRSLEQAVTAAVRAVPVPGAAPDAALDPARRALLDRLAERAQDAYAALVCDPDFLAFFGRCTPVDELGELQISSRPGRRGARRTIEDFRAIPWAFAWTQARALLPGWFGAGTALLALADHRDALRAAARELPFFTALLRGMERALAISDLAIFGRYVALGATVDAAADARFLATITAEHAAAVTGILDVLEQPALLANDPTLARSIALRNPYVDPLSFLQVRLLADHRRAPSPTLRDAIRLSINGIAAGLGVTG